jgi:hypothetical protein
MNRIFIILLSTGFVVFFNACKVINPTEATPFFLDIDSAFIKNVDYSLHGAPTSKLFDVWVYYNNQLLGGYELPARVPIIGEKDGIVTLQAGVLRNGLQADRLRYPFYKLSYQSLDWAIGNVKKIVPQFEYLNYDAMKMYIHEDFEIGNSFTAVKTDTAVVKSTNAIYGNNCGLIVLDSNHRNSDNIIEQKLDLLPNKAYYVELDYKSDLPIELYMLCTASNGVATIESLGGINAKSSWNKIYFDLGALVSVVKAKKYNLILSCKLPSGVNNGFAYIDNVKIIGPR